MRARRKLPNNIAHAAAAAGLQTAGSRWPRSRAPRRLCAAL